MAITYQWQSIEFMGLDLHEATKLFDEWFGYGLEEYSLTKQPIRRQSDGSLHLYLSHWPQATSHTIYVTALMQTLELP